MFRRLAADISILKSNSLRTALPSLASEGLLSLVLSSSRPLAAEMLVARIGARAQSARGFVP